MEQDNLDNIDRIRLCFFIGSLKIGGAQKHLVELINCLDRNIFDVFLVIGNNEDGFKEQLNLDPKYILCLELDKYYNLSGLKGLFVLTKYLKNNKIDILHSYLFECNIYSSIVHIFTPGIKFIMSIRNMNYTHGRLKIIATHYASVIANHVTVVCNKVGQYVVEREKINPNKITTLYNAVDNIIFTLPTNRLKNNDDGSISIVCVASLNYRKGQEYLLDAISLLLNQGRKIQLYLLGDGKNRKVLEELSIKLGISDIVTFAGYVKDVRESLGHMDIGVLSSFEEGMSNALLEYMAMGIPVVTTDVGGNREVNLDGVTGLVIPPRNSVVLANALDKLITDNNLRHNMGVNAKQRIMDEFSITKMKQEYTSFYLYKVISIK